MKILEKKYPKGTFKGQKTDGRYMTQFLYQNLDFMAEKITKDMTFLAVFFSSTLEVGTGKSVLATQTGEAWTDLVNRKYGLNIEFTARNLVFKPEHLIERAFEVPKYSCIILDEWEDATYWSKLGVTLRRFFRKCRQLNLFMIIIIPNWFQLPLNYAVSRSIFAIDIKFDENLDRGNYDFYTFGSKKNLYIKGKKMHNYNVQRADFKGHFLDGYGIPREAYIKAKEKDMKEDDEQESNAMTPERMRRELILKMIKKFPKIKMVDFANLTGVTPKTICEWKKGDKQGNNTPVSVNLNIVTPYNKIPSNVDGGDGKGIIGESEEKINVNQ